MDVEKSSTRRTFLKGTVLVGGLAMLFGLPRPSNSQPDGPKPREKAPTSGYRVTEQIRKYYESARL